jgi:hypothetical protein
MALTDATHHGISIMPTGSTDTTLEYNITRENGAPISVAKMNMKNNFTVYNASGSTDLVGYSNMTDRDQSGATVAYETVTQAFPGLYYGNVRSIKSDPEIQVTYDRISVSMNPVYIILIVVVIGVAATVVVVVFIRKRKTTKKQPTETT